jgi:hypothetical protein
MAQQRRAVSTIDRNSSSLIICPEGLCGKLQTISVVRSLHIPRSADTSNVHDVSSVARHSVISQPMA